MPPLLPPVTPTDVAVLDQVGARLRAAAAVLTEAGSSLSVASGADAWSGRSAQAAEGRSAAARAALARMPVLAEVAAGAVTALRIAVAAEASALAAAEREVRAGLEQLARLPGAVAEPMWDGLQRATQVRAWTVPWASRLPLPVPGSAAWRSLRSVVHGLLP